MNFTHEIDRIYATGEDGALLAEITFPATGPNTVVIDHTFVDPSLRGGGVAGQLMKAAYDRIRRDGKKTSVTCPYAAKWFERNGAYRDILGD